jgi:hypothetical protein
MKTKNRRGKLADKAGMCMKKIYLADGAGILLKRKVVNRWQVVTD